MAKLTTPPRELLQEASKHQEATPTRKWGLSVQDSKPHALKVLGWFKTERAAMATAVWLDLINPSITRAYSTEEMRATLYRKA